MGWPAIAKETDMLLRGSQTISLNTLLAHCMFYMALMMWLGVSKYFMMQFWNSFCSVGES